MKHRVRRFKSQKIALKELESFIRSGEHLQTGKPFKQFAGMRSRELLANWLVCAVLNAELAVERFRFTSDPVGGDGVVEDSETGRTWLTEHVMVPRARESSAVDIKAQILRATTRKQKKGGVAYARGKTLVVFLNSGEGSWFPNQVARALPKTDFATVWVVGLQYVEDGIYVYAVVHADLSKGNAPTWNVRISSNFDAWGVERLQ